MFRGEHASLNAIHAAVPSLCPASHAWGQMGSGGAFLVTGFLDMGARSAFSGGGGSKQNGSGMTLAKKLAKLHSAPAPIPGDYETPQFGFEAPTCCGDTVQDNGFMGSWAEFFKERRLLMILAKSERTNGKDTALRGMVEKTCEEVVPRLIGDAHLNGGKGVVPVVVHGDLWSGNKGVGRIDGGGEEEVVFDPSSCYAHSEYELGIMRMFGGFGAGFWREYHEEVPKTEPVAEYEDRVKLYECYHHLNHHVSFLLSCFSLREGVERLMGGFGRLVGIEWRADCGSRRYSEVGIRAVRWPS